MSTENCTTKRCNKCGVKKPATPEYFNRQSCSKDGLYSQCRECRRKISVSYIPSKPAAGSKCCSKCGVVKQLNEFHRYRLSADGYKHVCKLCRSRKEGFNYITPVPDGYMQCSQCGKVLPSTIEFFRPDKRHNNGVSNPCLNCLKVYNRQWRSINVDKIRAWAKTWRDNNRLVLNRMVSDWARRNPERRRVVAHKRRSRVRLLSDALTHEQWDYAVEYFHGCCAVCGSQCRDLFGSLTVAMDHWIPVNNPNCPGTIATNVVPLCHGIGGCNNRKSDRDPREFLETEFGKRKAKKIMNTINEYFASLGDTK